MTDVADLRIRVQSDSVPQAENRLRGLTAAGGQAERATDGLMSTFGRFASAAAIAGAAVATFNKLVSTQRQFDVINAGLITATGSAEDAGIAFEALQEFATKTPFDLQQVSTAFVKLVNLGLTPSEKALTSYGNTASAMGKDLSQMIEAVADASTGEFERLKEFGIKARKEGDQVTFMFRGVKTVVQNEAGQIEDYLVKLGENNFADSMSNRMKTLDGALSNLGDSWDQMFLNISNNGVGDSIAGMVNVALMALDELNEWLNSGELEGTLDAMAVQWKPWADGALEGIDIISEAFSDFHGFLESETPGVLDVLDSAWREFPQNVKAVVELATVYFAHEMEELQIIAEGVMAQMKAIFNDDTIVDARMRMAQQLSSNNANLEDSIGLILQERDATTEAAKAAHAAAVQAAEDRNKEKEARRAALAGKDRLAGYGVDRPASTGAGKEDKEAKAREKKAKQDFDRLVEDLRTEEEALQVSYDRRRKIIETGTSAESAMRQDLMTRLDKWRQEEATQIDEQKNREITQLQESLMTEEQAIEASYQRRKQIVLDNMAPGDEQTKLLEKLQKQKDLEVAFEQQAQQEKHDRLMQVSMTEMDMIRLNRQQMMDEQRMAYEQEIISKEEFERNKAAIEKQYHDASMALIREKQAQQMDAYGSMLGALGSMFGQFAQGQGKQAERMFKIQKALNLAQAIMSTATGIMRAQELGYPMNIVESIRVAAVGAMQVASIQSQKFSGAYDDGGRIPAGGFGVVGEKGMEIVQGPANVTSRRDTARMLRQQGEGGGSGDVNVSITVAVDNRGNASSSTEVQGGQGKDVENAKQLGALIDERVRGVLIKEQRQGGLLANRA